MKKNKIITGLDVGSSKVSAVAVDVNRSGYFGVLAQITHPSKGVTRGVVSDLNEAVRSVSSVLNKLKAKIPAGLGDIYVNISDESVAGKLSKGMIPLSLRGREVSASDIEKCVEASSTIYLPFDREIIHRIVQEFSIDDQPPINNPIGLYASRLSCDVYVVSANVSHMQNIFKCVNNSGYDIKDIVFTGLADSHSLLGSEFAASGSIIVDMGSALTEICSYIDGHLADLEVVGAGGEDFNSGFKDSRQFNDTAARIKSKLDNLSKMGKACSSIILTGGVSFGDGVVEYLEERLSCTVKMGITKDVRGDISSIDSVRLSTAVGLARYGQIKYQNCIRKYANLPSRLIGQIADLFNNYF